MVAFLAVLQLTMGARLAQAQQRLPQDRRTVEEALDLAGEDIGAELEELFEQLGTTAEKIGQKLEIWAEENSEELEAWSEKYGHKWEEFGNRFSKKMERMASDQEDVWNQWAQRYEKSLERWSDQLENEELSAENVGDFVERNLDMLSKMPLGQLVDQALEDGLSELGDAPWESLDELGQLAKSALEQPLDELSGLTIDGVKAKRALEDKAREMGRTFDRLKDDIGRNLSDSKTPERIRRDDNRLDARIRALKELRQREDATPVQIQRIDQMIDAIRDLKKHSSDLKPTAETRQGRVDVPRRDQIQERIRREKQRHAEALDQFNDDLKRSSEASRNIERQKLEMKWKTEDARKAKRVDGKDLDSNSNLPANAKKNQNQWTRDGRLPSKQKNQNLQKRDNKTTDKKADPNQESELDMLRKQIEQLRKEVERLKKEKS